MIVDKTNKREYAYFYESSIPTLPCGLHGPNDDCGRYCGKCTEDRKVLK